MNFLVSSIFMMLFVMFANLAFSSNVYGIYKNRRMLLVIGFSISALLAIVGIVTTLNSDSFVGVLMLALDSFFIWGGLKRYAKKETKTIELKSGTYELKQTIDTLPTLDMVPLNAIVYDKKIYYMSSFPLPDNKHDLFIEYTEEEDHNNVLFVEERGKKSINNILTTVEGIVSSGILLFGSVAVALADMSKGFQGDQNIVTGLIVIAFGGLGSNAFRNPKTISMKILYWFGRALFYIGIITLFIND